MDSLLKSGMYIRKITQKGKKNKNYTYYRLVENIRTEKGPRQRTILNLGSLNLPVEKHPLLAKRIQEYVNNQLPLFEVDPEVESLAFYFGRRILNQNIPSSLLPGTEVMLDTLQASQCRQIGAEQVGLSWFRYLELDRLLRDLGMSKRDVHKAALSIIGRLIAPGSERKTLIWGKERTALGELLGEDFEHISKNSIYQIGDEIYSHKEALETHLWKKEQSIFNLKEHLILYDLTNTYLEGSGAANGKAQFSISKEKRNDCRLITLGLVVDEQGFPKKSRSFKGNQSEPQSLKDMVLTLAQDRQYQDSPITVVLDAGIATEKNLEVLKKAHISYVVVSRRKHEFPEQKAEYVTIRENKRERIRVCMMEEGDEKVLYVHSHRKEFKEKSIRTKFEKIFEDRLNSLKEGLSKPHTTKRYEKVLERIGRLRERYRRISSYYDIEVIREGDLAVDVKFSLNRPGKVEQRYSGSYFLRTNRLDLDEKETWNTYNLIRRIERAFRYLKSDLGLRPIFHQTEQRSDAHLFISVLAYHLLNSIEHRLQSVGDHRSWATIRDKLSTHTRITVSLRDKQKKQYNVRLNVKPNEEQSMIYRNLLVMETMLSPKLTAT